MTNVDLFLFLDLMKHLGNGPLEVNNVLENHLIKLFWLFIFQTCMVLCETIGSWIIKCEKDKLNALKYQDILLKTILIEKYSTKQCLLLFWKNTIIEKKLLGNYVLAWPIIEYGPHCEYLFISFHYIKHIRKTNRQKIL